MSTLREELLALARKTDRGALEAKFEEAMSANIGDLDLFLEVGRTMWSAGRPTDAGKLLGKLAEHYGQSGSARDRARLFQFLATAVPQDRGYRKLLLQALAEVHKDRPAYELFLEASNLLEGDVGKALAALKQMERYDVGCYLVHNSRWGVGKVASVDSLARELVVHFESGLQHSLPVRSALEILHPIDGEDWRVLRAFHKERMKDLCENDPGDLIARMLKQTQRAMDSATIKDLLVPTVIPAKDWSRWWATARKAAMNRPDVMQEGRTNKLSWINPAENDVFVVMERAMTAAQVLDLGESFLRNRSTQQAEDRDSYQRLIQNLVKGAGKYAGRSDSSPLELLLLADDLAETHGFDRGPILAAIDAQIANEDQFLDRLSGVRTLKLARRGLDALRRVLGDKVGDSLVRLVPRSAGMFLDAVVGDALQAGMASAVRALVESTVRKPDQHPELLVWARRRHGNEAFSAVLAKQDPKVLLQRSLALGELKGKRIDPHLRKLARAVAAELLDNNGKQFVQFLQIMRAEEAGWIRQFLVGLRGLSDGAQTDLLEIVDRIHRPHAIEPTDDSLVRYDEDIVYCTEQGIEKRRREYEHMVNVVLPRIFEAIGKAAAFGDLSENAEYTAALEERATMTRKAEEMQEELKRARRIDESLLIESVATIGTRVTVIDTDVGEEETFLLLGPWDANVDEGILDYRAPLARMMLGRRIGEVVQGEIGGRPRTLEIRGIEKAL